VHDLGKTQEFSVEAPLVTSLQLLGVACGLAGVDSGHVASKCLTSLKVLFAGLAIELVFLLLIVGWFLLHDLQLLFCIANVDCFGRLLRLRLPNDLLKLIFGFWPVVKAFNGSRLSSFEARVRRGDMFRDNILVFVNLAIILENLFELVLV
jgi:hypothetical protein